MQRTPFTRDARFILMRSDRNTLCSGRRERPGTASMLCTYESFGFRNGMPSALRSNILPTPEQFSEMTDVIPVP
jgi:hypothetical protein